MTEPTEETNVGLELPTSDEIPMGDIELGIEPESEPPPYPTKPMTRRALASVLGCSDVNIGKRLRQLREFHPMSLLVEPSGKVSVFGCKEVMDLIAQGLDVYRSIQSEPAPAPEPGQMGIIIRPETSIVPPSQGTASGQAAITGFSSGILALLEKRRAEISVEHDELNQRRQSRLDALDQGAAAIAEIQKEEQRLESARAQDAMEEMVAQQVLSQLGKLVGVGYGPAQSA